MQMIDTGIRVEEYIDEHGHSAFGTFFDGLSFTAAAKVTGVVEKLTQGHKSGLKSVGGGVAEWRLDWGPGVRVYIHQDGATMLLLMGGSYGKGVQHAEIEAAQALVAEYKRRKKQHPRGAYAP
jgi:putative addiction module killer protein